MFASPVQAHVPLGHLANYGRSAYLTLRSVSVNRRREKYSSSQPMSQAQRKCLESPLLELAMSSQHLTDIVPKHLAVPVSALQQGRYISADSFFENKNGFSLTDLQRSSLSSDNVTRLVNQLFQNALRDIQTNPNHQARKTSFLPHIQFPANVRERLLAVPGQVVRVDVRGFKTIRGSELERIRSSSLVDRMKNRFAGRRTKDPFTSSEITHSEKLKSMLTEESLSNIEQKRLKVAFVEGYLAAVPTPTVSRTMRYLKLFQQLLVITVFVAILVSLMGSVSSSVFRVQVGNGNEVHPEEITVTFNDVKGVEEAKTELQEIVEFLKNPAKFSSLGGKLPKGVLLVGPPGTGKTLLARAVAGEAGVPFFHAAGPEFDEILVGQGARRVRDLFKAAKQRSPCVVFIDEIDSVGAKRTNSVLHPYANQTINQLLSEMDGFHQNEGVIVLGATNRREDLDKALLRPGRFDVEVQVSTPDYGGRKEILDLYLGKVKVAGDVNIDILARSTTGFTGADIENLVNQAAVRAAIEEAVAVGMKHLEDARDKVLMGPEHKSRIPDEEANLMTAYHEGGHALVAHYTRDAHPLHKVTIIPRGSSLGHTAYIPEKDRYHVTKSQLSANLDTLMGGRAAEELIFGPEKVTSGASSDLKQATAIATHMVKRWGMSEKVGLRTVDEDSKSLVVVNELSPTTNETIDSEIRRILQESYERAKLILKSHHREHKLIAEALLKYETLDADDVKVLLKVKDSKNQ